MRRQSGWRAPSGWPSISRGLHLLAIGLLLVIAMLTAAQLRREHRAILANAEHDLSSLATVFAEETGRALEVADQVVQAIIAVPPPQIEDLQHLLGRHSAGMPRVSALGMTDAAGHITRAAGAALADGLPPQAETLLGTFRQDRTDAPRFSPPYRAPDGHWAVLMARPRLAADGTLGGIAVAVLDPGDIAALYQAVALQNAGAIALYLHDGTLLVRSPPPQDRAGAGFADQPGFRDILARGVTGFTTMRDPLTGMARVVWVRALRSFPLAVAVSMDEDPLFAEWWRRAWLLGSGAALGACLLGWSLAALARRSRELETLLDAEAQARDRAERVTARLRDEMDERERAEAALRHTHRLEAIGQLTSGVAHDFNNLLTVVLGNVDMMLRDDAAQGGQTPNRARLAAIKDAAGRGAVLVNHLLAFARRQMLKPEPVDLNAVLLGMDQLLRSVLRSAVDLHGTLADGLWLATADRSQVETMVLNLVLNAREAMPDGGSVLLRTANRTLRAGGAADVPGDGDYVVLTVRDTGTGMEPAVAARAIEPFFTTKPIGAGSGLGLSQVFGTARQLGGAVDIVTAPGQGTAVSVYLPRAVGADLPSAAAPRMATSRTVA